MRAVLLVLLVALGGCNAAGEPPRTAELRTCESLGMRLQELPRKTLASLELSYGLAVVRLGPAADRAGLRLGDVVYGVNQREIGSLHDFTSAVAEPPDGRVSLLVRRGRTDLYVAIDPEGEPGRRPATDTLLRT